MFFRNQHIFVVAFTSLINFNNGSCFGEKVFADSKFLPSFPMLDYCINFLLISDLFCSSAFRGEKICSFTTVFSLLLLLWHWTNFSFMITIFCLILRHFIANSWCNLITKQIWLNCNPLKNNDYISLVKKQIWLTLLMKLFS